MPKWLKDGLGLPRDVVNGWYWGVGVFGALIGLGVVTFAFLTALGVCGSIQDRVILDGGLPKTMTGQQRVAVKMLIDQKVILTNDQALQIAIAHFTNLIVIVLAVLGLTAVISYLGISRKLKAEADSVVEGCVEKYVKDSVHFEQRVEDAVTEQLADRFEPLEDKLADVERRLGLSNSVAIPVPPAQVPAAGEA